MLGQIYTASAVLASVTAADQLMQLTAPADAVLALIKVQIGQFTLDTSEDYEWEILTRTTAGTGGTAVTPRPHQTGFAASGATALASPTAGTGGNTILNFAANVLSPAIWHPTPEEYIWVSASDIIQVATTTTLTSTDVSVFVTFAEIGG